MKAIYFLQKAQKHAEKVLLFCVFQRFLREKIGNNVKIIIRNSKTNIVLKTSFLQQTIKDIYKKDLIFQQLAGELDLNYKATAKDGSQYIVKVMRAACDPSLIALQCAAILHLEKASTKIGLPRVILTSTESAYTSVSVNGEQRLLWMLSYCPGTLLADFRPHTATLMYHFGESIAHITNGFIGFTHPDMKRGHQWELTEALMVKPYLPHITGSAQEQSKRVINHFDKIIGEQLQNLPHSVIHNDANDYNVLVQTEQGQSKVTAIFDFGDMGYQPTICELAVSLAYACMDKEDPLQICIAFLKGYSSIRSVSIAELAVLLDLIKTRLAVSIAISSYRQTLNPDDPYITISQAPAKQALHLLSNIDEHFANCAFRQACGYPVTDHVPAVMAYLTAANTSISPIMEVDSFDCVLDLSVGSRLLGAHPDAVQLPNLTKHIWDQMAAYNTKFSIGRYAENRHLYATSGFGHGAYPTTEKRTNHIGLDLFCDAGLPVFAPLDGTVAYLTIIDLPLDYGGLVILKHHTDAGIPFFTLYGHLSHDTLNHLEPGQPVKAGDQIATIGEDHENGGWPPHLHLQIIIDLLDKGIDFPGVALEREASVYKALCPNPALLFKLPNTDLFNASVDRAAILKKRKKMLGGNLSISYSTPLHIVKGFGQFLYDSSAQAYLDVYNNVPHVGHSHPEVVQAVQRQIGLHNTNTRYLDTTILQYAERLIAKMPKGLEVCYFVNSASEANELALRLARTYTKRKDMLVVASAYHGHTTALIDISPYKHNGPGGTGAPDWVHEVSIPDDYRGRFKRGQSDIGLAYAAEVKEKLSDLEKNGRHIAAFIAETYPSVGGQIITPTGYLKTVYEYVRAHGGLCIADEVQTGFGRLGDSFWGFESQDAIPDMVILGKPIANGFPLGAVVTTKAIAETFDNGMEFFSTFGGNPVACAAATAVLEVVEQQQLQANAKRLGNQFLEAVKGMQQRFDLIGDVRGEGFFLGVELVRDKTTLEPADWEANYIANRLKERYILSGTDGPLHNVLKFRPSMILEQRDMDYLLENLEEVFKETRLQRK